MQNHYDTSNLLNLPAYNPGNLLDLLAEGLKLKNDAALARALDVAPPVISKIRNRRLPVGPSMLLRMHDVSGFPVNDLRVLMGVPKVEKS